MTTKESTLPTLIGDTAAALLPADEGWSVREAGRDELLPAGSPVAIGCRAGDHAIVVIVAGSMGRRIQVGPPPADGLLDGLEPTMESVASVLGLGAHDELVEMAAADVVSQFPAHGFACALDDGDEHLVSVLVTPPQPNEAEEPAAEPAQFAPIASSQSALVQTGLEVLHDVRMGVTAELGRTSMVLKDILQLAPGSVIELDRAASSPVDVMVNGTLVARGEVVVIDEEFGIRITEVVGYEAPRQNLAPLDS